MIQEEHVPYCSIQYSQQNDGDMRNTASMQSVFGCEKKTLRVPILQHGSRIMRVPSSAPLECDALLTTDAQTVLGIRVADCLPLVLSAQGKGTALIHGGWRSLLTDIVPQTIRLLSEATHIQPENIYVWIGPSIQACCNAMHDAPEQMKRHDWEPYITHKNGLYHVDLQQGAIDQCLGVGVKRERILNTGICTFHNKDEYFSYRRYTQHNDKSAKVSHIGVVAWMKG